MQTCTQDHPPKGSGPDPGLHLECLADTRFLGQIDLDLEIPTWPQPARTLAFQRGQIARPAVVVLLEPRAPSGAGRYPSNVVLVDHAVGVEDRAQRRIELFIRPIQPRGRLSAPRS